MSRTVYDPTYFYQVYALKDMDDPNSYVAMSLCLIKTMEEARSLATMIDDRRMPYIRICKMVELKLVVRV